MRRGFTLVEILTALTIVVILAALLFPVIAGARKKAFEPADISNMKQLYTAFVMYEEDSGVGPMSTMLPFRAYTGDERIYASARDTYRKAYPDGTWPGRVFIPCGPERSPFKVSYAFIGSFPGYETQETWVEARQNSQLGLIASPWAGEPGELPFPSGRFQACGDVALDTVGPAMKGPIMRVNMDGSFYRFMGASGFAIGSPQELFIKR